MNNRFGIFLSKLRKSKNLTQLELAKELHVSDKTVSRWENGNIPDIETVFLISKYFNVSVEELYLGRRKIVYRIKIFLLLVIVLGLFIFINSFYKTYYYKLSISSNNYYLYDGYYYENKDFCILKLGNIKSLYNYDLNKLYINIYEGNKNLYSGFYNNIELSYKNKLDINNLYIEFIYNKNTEKYRLIFDDYKIDNYIKNSSDYLIKDNFIKRSDDIYIKEFDNQRIIFNIASKSYNRVILNDNYKEYINYYFDGSILNYQRYYKDDLVEEFDYYVFDKKYTCLIGRCSNYEVIYELIKSDIELLSNNEN